MGPRRRRGWYPESCAGPGRDLSGPECFQHDLPAAAVVTRFDRLRTDLAARITSEWKSPDELYLLPIEFSSANMSIELELRDTAGGLSRRVRGPITWVDISSRLPSRRTEFGEMVGSSN